MELPSAADLKHQVSLNKCRALYHLDKTEHYIEQAKSILRTIPNDPKAYLWSAIAYNNVKKDQDKKEEEELDIHGMDDVIYGELGHTFGALALKFS